MQTTLGWVTSGHTQAYAARLLRERSVVLKQQAASISCKQKEKQIII